MFLSNYQAMHPTLTFFNPLVPQAHNSTIIVSIQFNNCGKCENLPFPIQIKPVKVSQGTEGSQFANFYLFIFATSALAG